MMSMITKLDNSTKHSSISDDTHNVNQKLRLKIVNSLLDECSIDNIENSLIVCFMEKFGLVSQNQLINNILKNVKQRDKKIIEHWLITNKIELDLKNMERIFELLTEKEDRKLNGAFYTPQFLVDYIIDKTIKKDSTICDCACGSGAFLVEATKKISSLTQQPISKIIENNIYGIDIIDRNTKRTKILLTLLLLLNGEDKKNIKFNLITADSLSLNWKQTFPKIFDVVISNPPYVRSKNLPLKLRKNLHEKWSTASNGMIDLFIPFMELAVTLLNPDGVLGYIIPNSFATSRTSKNLRKFLQENRYLKEIMDFNHLQVFSDVSTYVCTIFLDKKYKNNFKYTLIHDKKNLKKFRNVKHVNIKFSNLKTENWRLLGEKDFVNINKIENLGVPLGELCRINTGLATLCNRIYEIKNAKLNNGYYEQKYNGKTFNIEKDITKEILKASIIKNEKDIKSNTRRIIFPYKIIDGKIQIISENEMKKYYPNCYDYFLTVKNELKTRDKGKGKYDTWYAYGRTQGLEHREGPMLLTPDISNKPKFSICNKKNIVISIGYGLWLDSKKIKLKYGLTINLKILKKILNSKIFFYYIDKTSRHYGSGYKSFNKHYIQKFSIPHLSENDVKFLTNTVEEEKINNYLTKLYDVKS